jgi:glycosyltransferase involved in cell wall biosynthesis/thymidylate kinase
MNKKIKVGIFVDGDFIPAYDGASNRFHYLSRHLALNGVDVVVFHGYRKWSDVSLVNKEPFKTYFFNIENYYSNLELLASLLKMESVDIIQFDNLEPILLQGIRLSKLTGAKLVSEMHYVVRNLARKLGADKHRLIEIEKMEKKVGESIDHLITLSYEDKEFIEEYMGVTQERISVIPSGVDCREIRYFGPNLDERNIIFLGNLYFKPNEDAVRRIRNLIYPELQKHGFRFTIAGDCPEALRADCETEDFKFTGTLSDLNDLFKKATLALSPIDEGTGMRIKLLNYLTAGIPILTTSIAASGFSNKDIFFMEDDYSNYSKRILELVKDRKRLIGTSNDGRAEIEKTYDWNIIAKKTVETYQKLMQNEDVKKIEPDAELIKTKEPVWLQEAISKKRFKEINSSLLPDTFSFAVSKNGSLVDYQLNKIIAIEGMPGAGKTTFIKEYVDDDKITFLPQLQVSESILSKDNLETSKQFLFTEHEKTQKIQEVGKKYTEIVLDRTFFTTLAYCYARSKINNTSEEFDSLLLVFEGIKNTITFPTHVIYLDVSVDESLKRRSAFANDDRYKNWFNPLFLSYLREFYTREFKKFFPEVLLYLDTTNTKISDVSSKIRKTI